jgi:DNA/RNA-binding domain of Phe-tRNA-synthetase-like protein
MTACRWTVTVADSIFEVFPGYRRGVIWATNVMNDETPSLLMSLLSEATCGSSESQFRSEEHCRMACWREAFTALGDGTMGCATSFEDIPEWVSRSHKSSMGTCIESIATILSRWHVVPVTAIALDELHGGLTLRIATGQERFLPASTEASYIEHPHAGEAIGTHGETALIRNWHGRLAHRVQITRETTAVLLCVDAMPVIASTEIEGICEEAVSLLDTYSGSTAQYAILSQHAPQVIVQ